MLLSYLAIVTYFIASWVLVKDLTKDSPQYKQQKNTALLISLALLLHAFSFTNFLTETGVSFSLANSASFMSWLIALLLLLATITKPVQALGVLVYPLTAITFLLSLIFPDINNKIITPKVASHVLLSITAYAMLALVLCQSILLKIQKKYLHKHQINNFINKLPALQTMEKLLLQNLKIGFYLLTLSLISGLIFIDDFFAQHLAHKTVLSFIAWLIFAILIFGRKLFGWKSRQTINFIQTGFVLLIISYFGSKFVLERLIGL